MTTNGVIRLATFNILHGARPSDGSVDLERFGDAVRSLDADILALQEVDHHQARSGEVALTAVAAEAMGAQTCCFVPVLPGRLGEPGPSLTCPEPVEGSKGHPDQSGYGIALISRFPAADWRSLRLPRWPTRYPVPRPSKRRIDLRADEPRGAMAACFETSQGPLTVANVHLSYLPGIRERQIGLVLRRLRPVDEPFVVLGDFNLRAPWPSRLTRLQPLATHLTFPADRPDRQIDHALTAGGVEAIGSHAVDLGLSDHQALVVDVRVTGTASLSSAG